MALLRDSRTLQRILALVLLFVSIVAAADDVKDPTGGALVHFPNEVNITYHYLDVLNVTYTSEFDKPEIWVFCQNYADRKNPWFIKNISVTPRSGSALVQIDWTSETPCWINVRPDPPSIVGANSADFIVGARGYQLTIGPSGTSTKEVPKPTSETSISTTATSTASYGEDGENNADGDNGKESKKNDDGSWPSGVTAGVAIGISLAVIGVGALIATMFVRRQNQKRQHGNSHTLKSEMSSPGSATHPFDRPVGTPSSGPYHQQQQKLLTVPANDHISRYSTPINGPLPAYGAAVPHTYVSTELFSPQEYPDGITPTNPSYGGTDYLVPPTQTQRKPEISAPPPPSELPGQGTYPVEMMSAETPKELAAWSSTPKMPWTPSPY